MWIVYIFFAVIGWIVWRAVNHSRTSQARQQALSDKLRMSGFPISEEIVDVQGSTAIAKNARGDRFLLARRDDNDQIRLRSLSAKEILAVGIVENRTVLHEYHREDGNVSYGKRRLKPPPDPNIEAVKNLMQKVGMDPDKVDAASATSTVDTLQLLLVIDDGGASPYERPFSLGLIRRGEGPGLIHQRGSKWHRHAMAQTRQWMGFLVEAIEQFASLRQVGAAASPQTVDATKDAEARESLRTQIEYMASAPAVQPLMSTQEQSLESSTEQTTDFASEGRAVSEVLQPSLSSRIEEMKRSTARPLEVRVYTSEAPSEDEDHLDDWAKQRAKAFGGTSNT